MRPFRFVIHLKEFGWEPTVLTIAAEGQELTEKEARLLEGIDIIELKPPFDRTTAAESQLGKASRQKKSTSGGHSFGLGLLDHQFPVDTWLLFFWMKYRQILRVVQRVQPHVMWSTGDPWSGLVIGGQLARRFGIPWVADFRDPWTLSEVRSEGQWALTQTINRFCERRVLETAEVVLFQAEQTERVYQRHYAEMGLRTTTIYNSYDPAVFEDPVELKSASARGASDGDRLRIGFFGRFRSMSPASLMTDVLAEARRRHGAAAEAVEVHSFGPLNEEDARYAEEKGVLEHFRRQEAVPLEKALSALRQFDLLLLSTDPRRDQIIPAKLLEYLAAARPVLSFSRNPEVAEILQRTGTGLQLDPGRTGEIADLLVACLEAKREERPLPLPFEPRPEEIRKFEACATTEELASLFDSVLHPAAPGRP